MTVIETKNLAMVFGVGDAKVNALKSINMSINRGEFVAVMGPSGCGKSTLLHLLGGLDKPTSGSIFVEGKDITQMNDNTLTVMRRKRMGFIFQYYNLIPVINALDNTALPLVLDGARPTAAKEKAEKWLVSLGLGDRLMHRPDQLSGGQQQRVAIARALVAEPALILADEPTGNLDSKASDEVVEILKKAASEWKRTILMVTHDSQVASRADRIVFLKDGSVVDEVDMGKNAEKAGE